MLYKEIKLKARKALFKNYKYAFVIVLLQIVFPIIDKNLTKYGIGQFVSGEIGIVSFFLISVVSLAITVCVMPILSVCLFKFGIMATYDEGLSFSALKFFLNFENIGKIVLINLMPSGLRILDAAYSYLDNNIESIPLQIGISYVALILSCIVYYKFFIANYYFALTEGSVKESLNASFGIMKNKVWKLVRYNLSFAFWILLLITIGIIINFVALRFEIDITILQLLSPAGFGVAFYYNPYKAFADTLYCEGLLKDKLN